MSEDVVWCNLVRNQNKNAENQPDWVAPPNLKAPEGKKWTIGVKIGDVWHNQAGWFSAFLFWFLTKLHHTTSSLMFAPLLLSAFTDHYLIATL